MRNSYPRRNNVTVVSPSSQKKRFCKQVVRGDTKSEDDMFERFPSLGVGLEVVTGIHRHFKAIWEGVIFTDPSETCMCHLCVLFFFEHLLVEAAVPPEGGEVDASKLSEATRKVRVYYMFELFLSLGVGLEVIRDISRQSVKVYVKIYMCTQKTPNISR